MGNDQSIFRKEALEHINTPEKLNEAIAITTPLSWVILCGLLIVIFAFLLWSIFGSINLRVEGQGILLPNTQGLYTAVAPKGVGQVTSIDVKLDQIVQPGQVVVHIANPYLKNQIESVNATLQELKQKYKELTTNYKTALLTRHNEVLSQTLILNNTVSEQEMSLAHTKELLKMREEAYKQGLVTKQELLVSWQEYYTIKKNIEDIKGQIIQNQINEKSFIDDWNQRVRDLDLRIKDKSQELRGLIIERQTGKSVLSPIHGKVTNIQVQIGDTINEGKPVLSITPLDTTLVAIAYVPIERGKKIKSGMNALVTPSFIKKEEYGSLIGKVIYIADYPSDSSSMNAILKNENLVKKLLENEVPIEVRIEIEKDPHTYSGFRWTSSKGPEQQITPGTMVMTSIIVEKKHPVSLLIPGIKKLFGS